MATTPIWRRLAGGAASNAVVEPSNARTTSSEIAAVHTGQTNRVIRALDPWGQGVAKPCGRHPSATAADRIQIARDGARHLFLPTVRR